MIERSIRTDAPKVRVLYTDIDGTIRWGKDELGRFVNGPEDVRVFDEVPKLLHDYKRLGWRIVGITNQGGIALGHMDTQTCIEALDETQRQTGNMFDKIVFCPHHPQADDAYMAICWCRKPKAGLVIEAAMSLSIMNYEIYPPHMGIFVGDRPEDEQCAQAAGLTFWEAEEWRKGAHLDLFCKEIARPDE